MSTEQPVLRVGSVRIPLREFTQKDRKLKGAPHANVFLKNGTMYEVVDCEPFWLLCPPGDSNVRGLRGIAGNINEIGDIALEADGEVVSIPLENGLTGKPEDKKRNPKRSGTVQHVFRGKVRNFSFLASQTSEGVMFLSAGVTNLSDSAARVTAANAQHLEDLFA